MPGDRAAAVERLTERIRPAPIPQKVWGLLNPADGLCSLCLGSGHLICHQDGKRESWACPACGGAGARCMFGHPSVRRGKPAAAGTATSPPAPGHSDGRTSAWADAIRWLRERADSHAGRWSTMEPREALKDAAREMEAITP